jgi:hypothetical protein
MQLAASAGTGKGRTIVTLCLSLILVVFITFSMGKFPAYVIGVTEPIRSAEPIDGIHYWNFNAPQYAVVDFLREELDPSRAEILTIIMNYFSQLVFGNARGGLPGAPVTVLHDKFYGTAYTYREQFPDIGIFHAENKIYSSADYVIFIE